MMNRTEHKHSAKTPKARAGQVPLPVYDLPVIAVVNEGFYVLPVASSGLMLDGRFLVVDPSKRTLDDFRQDDRLVVSYGARGNTAWFARFDEVGRYHFALLSHIERLGAVLAAGLPECEEHPLIVGAVVGEITDPALQQAYREMFHADNAGQYAQEAAIADAFDVDRYLAVEDSIGTVTTVLLQPNGERGLFTALCNIEGVDISAVYQANDALYLARRAAGPAVNRKIADRCEELKRVHHVKGGAVVADPGMPSDVAAILEVDRRRREKELSEVAA